MARVTEKEITLEGRTFRLRKFDPETGCYWGLKLFGSMASGFGGAIDLANKVQEFVNMPRAQFKEFQRDCLSHVSECLAAGPAAVINAQGVPTVVDFDHTLAFELMIHSFMFSIADFFTPALLDRLMGAIMDVMPSQEEETPENTTEPPKSSIPLYGTGIGDNMSYGMAPTP